jgi:serine/threonine protein kinase/tetratricopeptide (TPR) repeat protein
MTPARLQTIEEIFRAALDQEPDQISAFLDTACEGDELLRRKVEALLASRQRAATFIETSVVGLARSIIQSGQTDLLIGQTIGHYKISKRIGSGGMGEVYLASDSSAGRQAALKLLPTQFAGDAGRMKRFQQEARAVAGLNHPNILTIYEVGADSSLRYIASELIEGETLRQRLGRESMQLSEAVEISIQVAGALAAAHEAGVVHRDVKPENIMLRPDGYVKVLDFGIAKLAEQEVPVTMAEEEALLLVETNLGSVLGTVRYMSPEQARGANVDRRTDIWSLGVVLYEMVTGHVPFTGDTPGEVMSSILEREPLPLTSYLAHSSAELQQIISKTLRKDREERYHSAHELLEALKDLRHKLEFQAESDRFAPTPSWLRWTRSPTALALPLLVAAVGLALPFYRHWNRTPTSPPEKSIAVLPFENLNDQKENSVFTDGVQDDILTKLAKIADLKVISRTSVMEYRGKRNVRQIGDALRVSHVLEGSARRSGDRIHLNAQLIDTRTDTHVWAEEYDRDLNDLFAIQSEIAQKVADQLRSKLSHAEKAAIAERPTADLAAYALYTKAMDLDIWGNWEGVDKSMNQRVELLEKATQHDPNFPLAYCALAKAQTYLFSNPARLWEVGNDRMHLELAKKAADAALRVRPDFGEAHLELARYYFYAGDYDRARDELTIARQKLPNNSEALVIEGRIDRHQNRWDAALANLQKAYDLDPRNVEVAWRLGQIYYSMRRYHDYDQLRTQNAANGILPGPWLQLELANTKLDSGDPVAAQSFLAQVPLDFSPTEEIWNTRFVAALYLRDYDAANRVLAAIPAKWADDTFDGLPLGWAEGLVARARGDKQKAQSAFATAREKLEATRADKPKDAHYFEQISELDAGLGRKEDAIREALRAVSLMPIATDSEDGPTWLTNLAVVCAWTGERDRALEQLEIVATIPNGPSYGDLKFNPCWDSLRGDKRFDKIVAAAKAASR